MRKKDTEYSAVLICLRREANLTEPELKKMDEGFRIQAKKSPTSALELARIGLCVCRENVPKGNILQAVGMVVKLGLRFNNSPERVVLDYLRNR